MMKRTIIPLLIAALVALLLPWLAVTFAKGDNGMAVIFLLFFAVNPITAVLLGGVLRRQCPHGVVPAAAVRRAVPAGHVGVLHHGRNGVCALRRCLPDFGLCRHAAGVVCRKAETLCPIKNRTTGKRCVGRGDHTPPPNGAA